MKGPFKFINKFVLKSKYGDLKLDRRIFHFFFKYEIQNIACL